MEILSLNSISKKYSGALSEAVKNISFAVDQGEILALVGESGSGKTTLLRLIAGLEHPDSGKITLFDKVIAEDKLSLPANERKIGMVFQDYALFPHLTVLENVVFGLRQSSKDAVNRAKEVLELVGLRENVQKYPHQLSGGQQQRVALARALAPSPSILLMDEPFSNLDAVLKDQVREEVRLIIKKTGITAIFVTHDTRDALSTADRIAILHQGNLEQIGTPRELYESPVNRYVANFFGKQNELAAVAMDGGFHTSFGFIPHAGADQYFGEVRLLFRPEHVFFASFEPAKLVGEVFKASYFGDYQIIKIADKDGKRITMKCPTGIDINAGQLVHFLINSFRVEIR